MTNEIDIKTFYSIDTDTNFLQVTFPANVKDILDKKSKLRDYIYKSFFLGEEINCKEIEAIQLFKEFLVKVDGIRKKA